MTIWYIEPEQGFSSEQGLSIIGRPITLNFQPPQGISGGAPTLDNELIEETIGNFDFSTFDDGTNSGFVLIEGG